MKNGSCRQKAFTLLELVMVMAIVILMALIMIPYITQNIDASAAIRTRMRLYSWARWAQSHAITEQRPYRIVFNFGNHSYTVQRYNGVSFADIETVVLQEGVTFQNPVSIEFPSGILEFNQFGAPVPNGGGIYIRNINLRVSVFSVADVTGSMTPPANP